MLAFALSVGGCIASGSALERQALLSRAKNSGQIVARVEMKAGAATI